DVFAPYIKALNAMPRVVLGSIFIITIGYGIWSKVALAVVLVFFVVFFNAFQGVREVDRVMIANARILGATERQLSTHVILPSALSWILASLHTSFGFALVGAVVGEYLGAIHGIGLVIATAQATFNPNGVFAAMFILAIVALTEALGYFKEQNLTVNLIDEPSGKDATTALIAGEVEASSGSYDHTIDVAGLGKNLVEVVQLLRAPGEAEMVATKKANDIKGPADFKGRNLGVTSIGSGTHGLTQYLASTKGIVQRVVNAYVKTLKWIATHSPAEIADKLPADYYAGDKDLYLSALTGSMPMYSPDGKMPAGAPDFILKVLQTYNQNVKGKTIDLTKTWTNEYVDAAK